MAVVCAAAIDAQRLADELPFFEPSLAVRLLADWETLPYDHFSPHQDLISERLDTLYALQQGQCDVVVVAATTALHRLAPPSFLASHTFYFDKGQRLDEAALRAQLGLAGYEPVSQVVKPGEYAVRGGLIDLFPMGAQLPYRLDLFGEQIDAIRTFDPDTQRSLYPIERVRLLPGREFPTDEATRTAFRGRWRERFEGDPSRAPLYRDIANGIAGPGIEYWLPLFFDATATLFDYLPGESMIVTLGDVDDAARRFTLDTAQRYKFLAHDVERPLLRPDELFVTGEQFFAACAAFARCSLARATAPNERPDDERTPQPRATPARRTVLANPLPGLAVNRRAERPLALLEAYLNDTPHRTLIVAESAGRRETLLQLFAEYDLLDGAGAAMPQLESWSEFASGAERSRSVSRRCTTASNWRATRSPSSPRRSCSPELRGVAPAVDANPRPTSTRSSATCPSSGSATRSCTRSTASGATRACALSTTATARPSFST